MSEAAWCMEFHSENAQKYAKKDSDHHKTWEQLRVTYLHSIYEFLVPYVQECLKSEHGKFYSIMKGILLIHITSCFHVRSSLVHGLP